MESDGELIQLRRSFRLPVSKMSYGVRDLKS